MLPPPISATTHREAFSAWIVLQERQYAEIRDAVGFGFVDRFHLEAGRTKDAVQKRQPIQCLTHSTCRHDAKPCRIGETVLIEHAPIHPQYAHALFRRRC